MKRTFLLAPSVLALLLAACGGGQAETPTPTEAPSPVTTPTQDATPEPTESEAEETAAATDGGDGSVITGDLADVLPDDVGGFPRQDVPGLDEMIAPMLQQQGIDASDADLAFASWGEGTEAVIVTAMRMPGLNETQLEMLASLLAGTGSGAPGGVEFEGETTTVGGKEVVRMTGEGTPGSAYVYFAGDAFFTVVSESPELAEELLSQLP